ncbi:MAG: hypothetical protein HYZ54_01060 [Ignavibacteriae bacterium]|nr:hypothetical protein [Ignavibacteriota bacterium]
MKTLIAVILLFSASYCSAQYCPGWRWKVKALADDEAKGIDFTKSRSITFEQLKKLDHVELNLGDWFMKRRIEEKHYVKITGKIIQWKVEPNDYDYHIVVSDGTNYIVCEIPNPECDGVKETGHVEDYKTARAFIRSLPNVEANGWHIVLPELGKFTLYGVIFHDFEHAAFFSMPHGLEIHPVLRIEWADSSRK